MQGSVVSRRLKTVKRGMGFDFQQPLVGRVLRDPPNNGCEEDNLLVKLNI